MKVMAMIVLMSVFLVGISVIGQETNSNPHGKLKWECNVCHNTQSWNVIKSPIVFKHEETGFGLLGAHGSVACDGCHKNMKFAYVGTACADCHTDIHRGQFGNGCEDCHTPIDWRNRQDILSLHAGRGFPLVGVHSIVDCGACHVNQQHNEFAGTPIDCGGCHRDNFMATTNPDHARAGFKLDCQPCHQPTSASWMNANYQHPSTYSLQGLHVNLECISCHASTYAGTPRNCIGCHSHEYQEAGNPPHASLGFPPDCTICHNQIQWAGAAFDHLQATGFDIVGAHTRLRCIECHFDNRYAGTPTACYGCHLNDYTGAADPDHVTNNFGYDCRQCHNTTVWTPATFDHSQTRFPLTGAHTSQQCIACHANGYQSTPFDCYSCHQADYNSAADPNHVRNNFSQDCTQCHSTAAWSPATFSHSQTQFPLTGAHITLQCIACHANGYQNTPTDCYSCHQSDYNSVPDPNHVINNFSHDCTQCHSTAAWSPATFDHNQTQFPLTGAHIALQCIACHANGYQNTPTDCYSCHASDFNGATNPNHVALGFPTQCILCHNTIAWSPSTFNHDGQYFPIFSGHHQGAWSVCADCHLIPNDYSTFECIYCHEHNQTDTDQQHQEVPGYRYVSISCYSCHPTGSGGGE